VKERALQTSREIDDDSRLVDWIRLIRLRLEEAVRRFGLSLFCVVPDAYDTLYCRNVPRSTV
jgi:hypothetical protein